MRHKPKYNNMRLVYVDIDDTEHLFYCNDVSANKYITNLIGQPIKDSGSRFITDSDIDFQIDAVVMMNGTKKRITQLPDIKLKGNNSRRGYYRADKVIETT
ncbi:MAG: hypothetical protein PF440_08645 [Thiomicrorhabdus sp.]|jgi:hypothetical protein|nr:hypothetical protein [Thiomicrorhabdus sp.]